MASEHLQIRTLAVIRASIGLVAMMVGFAADGPGEDGLRTVAERSEYRATARHDEVVALCRRLAESSPSVRLDELGKTTEGRSLPLLIVADPPVKTPEEAARSGKLVVLLLGNIHAGEVCGKEALPMLVREILAEPGHPLLRDLILAVVPIYNADGNERVSKTNRPGQVGPEEGMGQRANAQGFDLNRDFVKLEAPETRALVRFLGRWEPHLFVDTHTTNGSHHRYTITYQGPVNPAGDRDVIEFARRSLFPGVGRAFKERTGLESFYYGNFDRDHTKWTTYGAQPRFSTSYVGMRNRLSVLSEAYAYAPYKTRVLATRDYVRECLAFASAHKDEIARLLDRARSATIAAGRDPKPDDRVAVRCEAKAFPEPATVLGVVEKERDGRRVATDEPKDYRVEMVQDFAPTETVGRPFAYLLPPKEKAAIELLQRHGIELAELREDVELDLEVYRVDRISRVQRAFQGHHEATLEVTPRTQSRRVEAGTVVVPTAQPLGSLAVFLLEPRSDDGLATWNVFDASLAEGADFPAIRLPRPAPLLTSPARPLPEDRPRPRPITFDSAQRGGPRGGLGDSAASVRWLDAEHLMQTKDGRAYKVQATTGRVTPFFDTGPLAEALARLGAIDEEAARALARQVAEPSPFRRRGGGGVTLNPAKTGALFEHEGDLYYATLDGKTAVRLTKTPAREELASFSPDGKLVAFVRDNDLHVVEVATQAERPLTRGGVDRLRHGKADWVYFEEVFNRNSKAYWWSPDSARVAFLEFDDAPVKDHVVVNDTAGARDVEQTPYPRSGDPNPKVRLGLVAAAGGPVRWADLSEYPDDDRLIVLAGWWPDGQSAFAYVQDRAQTWLDVVRIPSSEGPATRLFRETTKAWVDNPGAPHFLGDGTFLLPSERDGWKHLYRFSADGQLQGRVTSGEWEVRSVEHVDESGGWVYFTATKDSPIAVNLYRVRLGGGPVERLTWGSGSHAVAMSPDGRLFVDTWSDVATPSRVALASAEGRVVRTLDRNPARVLDDYRFGPRELVQIKARDGFLLEGELILPPDLDPKRIYPVWFTTYGGPHAPTVSDAWHGGRAWEQALAAEGFVVFRADPSSASGKGAVSTWSAYKQLGVKELQDIEDAIAWLKRKPYVDGARIGMSGHSYGGFMTAYALTHSRLFAAGIAGAPVTDWHDYDSIYTERYMLTPKQNADGYDRTSVVAAAGDLHGKLLILHGAIDDNVSVRNTIRLVHALQQADKDFELMLYPSSRHGILGRHYNRLQVDFIRRTLGGPREKAKGAE
jgi:dipeptidyl aminopeptidase/acylaminoacyl peptidase